MELKVDKQLLKEKREKNVWSQQQLADISGLSLRTVQRIEKLGSSSPESIKAISSAFELTPADFIVHARDNRMRTKITATISFVFTLVLASLTALYFQTANAKPLLLKITYSSTSEDPKDVSESQWDFLADIGKKSLLKLSPELDVYFYPSTTATGDLSVSIQLFEREGEHSNAMSLQPSTMVGYDRLYMIEHSENGKDSFHLSIVAKKN